VVEGQLEKAFLQETIPFKNDLDPLQSLLTSQLYLTFPDPFYTILIGITRKRRQGTTLGLSKGDFLKK